MTTGQRIDPYRGFKYRVEIDGIRAAAFSEATIPDTTTESVEYREGTDPNYSRVLSGLTKYGSLTLKKGITDSMDLYDWRKLVEEKGAASARKNISLILIDEESEDKCRWNIYNAWPTKYENSGFSASSNEVAIETLEIILEYMQRLK